MNHLLAEHIFPTGQTIQIVQGDITTEEVDAIVNAANEHLQHGGGVARTIAKKGGPTIQKESDAWVREHGTVTHKRPAWTSGGELPARYVLHAVGPVWRNPQTESDFQEMDNNLAFAVTGSLVVADELHCSSIALPAISTGIFGFPKERAASIIYGSIERYFAHQSGSGIKIVKILLYDQPTVDVFRQVWQERWSE